MYITELDLFHSGSSGSKQVFPLYRSLSEVFTDHYWAPWKFKSSTVPRKWWEDKNNQLEFMKDLMKQLGYKSLTDCYNITAQQIAQHGGHRLLSLYKSSPAEIMTTLFPQHQWDKWKFTRSPKLWWKKSSDQRQLMDRLKQQFGWTTYEDLYNLTSEHVIRIGGMLYAVQQRR